jgi:hypothetical protein
MIIPNILLRIFTRELLKQNKERGQRFQEYSDDKNPKDCKEDAVGTGIADGVCRIYVYECKNVAILYPYMVRNIVSTYRTKKKPIIHIEVPCRTLISPGAKDIERQDPKLKIIQRTGFKECNICLKKDKCNREKN